jgi:hypothetical protein
VRDRLFRALLAALLSLGIAGAAAAKSSCVAVVPVDRKLVAALDGQFQAISVKGLPPILIAHLFYLNADERVARGLAGTVVFVRKAPRRWTAFFPADRETEAYTFVAPAAGAFVMLTEWSVEGPMPHWTAVRTTRRFSRFECASIAYPKHLSDYRVISNEDFRARVESFSGDARGRTRVVVRYRGGPRDGRYVYNSRGAAFRFAVPARSGAKPLARNLYAPAHAASKAETARLVADLNRSVGIR